MYSTAQLQSWLDTSGTFHVVPGYLTHYGMALQKFKMGIADMFMCGYMRIFWVGDQLYMNNDKGIAPNEKQLSEAINLCLYDGRFNTIRWDSGLHDKILWERES